MGPIVISLLNEFQSVTPQTEIHIPFMVVRKTGCLNLFICLVVITLSLYVFLVNNFWRFCGKDELNALYIIIATFNFTRSSSFNARDLQKLFSKKTYNDN